MIEALQQAAVLADPLNFWIICLVVAVLAGFLLRLGLNGFWRLRTVVDTPTARVRSAPQGYVELTGLSLPYRGSVRAALTGLPCLWYRFKIEEKRGTGKSRRWVTVESGEADSPFLLDDGTGRCLVEPNGAELHCRGRLGASTHLVKGKNRSACKSHLGGLGMASRGLPGAGRRSSAGPARERL